MKIKSKEQLLTELMDLVGKMNGQTNPYVLNTHLMNIGEWLHSEVRSAYLEGKKEVVSWEKTLPKN